MDLNKKEADMLVQEEADDVNTRMLKKLIC